MKKTSKMKLLFFKKVNFTKISTIYTTPPKSKAKFGKLYKKLSESLKNIHNHYQIY